jgi:CspA family cold shock protein
MAQGNVKFYNEDKGFGMIQTGDGDLLVRRSEIRPIPSDDGPPSLREGELVEFKIEQGSKGPEAKDVVRM